MKKTYIKSTLSKQAYYKLDHYINDKNAWKYAGPAPQDNLKPSKIKLVANCFIYSCYTHTQ